MMKYTPAVRTTSAPMRSAASALAPSDKRQRHPEIRRVTRRRDKRQRVGGDAEIGGMTEADQPGVAHQQIERQRENRQDHDLGHELHVELSRRPPETQAAAARRQSRTNCESSATSCAWIACVSFAARTAPTGETAARPPSAGTPRHPRTRARAPCRTCRRIRSAATRSSAPLSDPMPPMTTTTKQTISTWLPMPGKTDETGAAIMPANAASATPAAKTSAWIQRMLSPSDSAISGFDAPARIIMPRRVFWIDKYISAASSDAYGRNEQAIHRIRQILGQRQRCLE